MRKYTPLYYITLSKYLCSIIYIHNINHASVHVAKYATHSIFRRIPWLFIDANDFKLPYSIQRFESFALIFVVLWNAADQVTRILILTNRLMTISFIEWNRSSLVQINHNPDENRKCVLVHDDVIKRKSFPRYWPFVRVSHRSPVNSPHKGQWRGALMLSLICAWINGWVNNREDLRRHRSHYDVTVI